MISSDYLPFYLLYLELCLFIPRFLNKFAESALLNQAATENNSHDKPKHQTISKVLQKQLDCTEWWGIVLILFLMDFNQQFYLQSAFTIDLEL